MPAITRAFFDKIWPAASSALVPIFSIGLLRSRATLVNSTCRRTARRLGCPIPPWPCDRNAFVRAGADADRQKAERLLQRLSESQPAVQMEKTSVNFLYVGLIARALPDARIVHVGVNPTVVGSALVKTLFQTDGPHANDLTDIGYDMCAWSHLTTHWRDALSSWFINIDHEAFFDDLDGEARPIVADCKLPWEAAYRDFHLNRSLRSTASGTQIRRLPHRSSAGLWRHYENELAPPAQTLKRESVL
ncbi:sulfotransferase family protein [Rhizobium leguminosarum]|uniref:sulfotransferase family protein n=1 Tax=Rhizobium leguminosarum TaxID=384 RepID=UPI001AE29638|nr:sulfotransferase [Rhizobium leguminosarum]MBP2444186.1 hypothetical protein [Rhizobium leguminosarum]